MNGGGSRQLREFRIAVRDGATMEAAAGLAGISLTEAKLILEADRADLPPPECYLPIGVGHNSQEKEPMSENVAADQLRLFVERIERLEDEKRASPTTSRTSMLKLKAKVMTPRPCARSSVCARWRPTPGRSEKRCSKPT
ncbi:hypothetical protein HNQ99_002672 [Rhizorhapis suberifaciens]|uniref:GapR-like DNA-binding domain-containing protein n=1 Tax=Rhizorhapis suberifaciens TaxID=13656 RepID=A0A840HXM0_9SPHN|nr:hypothetical protein [Rhizorhapis suberifaciens]